MDGQQDFVSLPLTRDEAQELLARLLLSHDDDNDLSASLMKRLAHALEGNGSHSFGFSDAARTPKVISA